MKDINGARQIPYSAWIGALFSGFAPINLSTKLADPTKDSGILVYNPYGCTSATNDDASLSEKEANKHPFIYIAFNEECSGGERYIAPNVIILEKQAHRSIINPESFCYLVRIFTGLVCSYHGVFLLIKNRWPNWWSNLDAVSNKKMADRGIGASKFLRKGINRCTLFIESDNFVTVAFKYWCNWFAAHADLLFVD